MCFMDNRGGVLPSRAQQQPALRAYRGRWCNNMQEFSEIEHKCTWVGEIIIGNYIQ